MSSVGTANGNSMACGASASPETVTALYPIGSIWHVIKSARKGILESVAIKKYHINTNILYIDTLNSMWNEDDLCDRNTAILLAIDYYERLLEQSQAQC